MVTMTLDEGLMYHSLIPLWPDFDGRQTVHARNAILAFSADFRVLARI